MRKVYIFAFLLLTHYIAFGQCTLLSNAVPGLVLDYQSTDLLNCSAVAFNPILGRYYGVRAGNATFPLETWSATGTQLYTTLAGWDFRGLWWNPSTNQLEGNGYANLGMWRCDLDGTGNALGSGSLIFSGQSQPNIQSVGAYDPTTNEVLYYNAGAIYRYSRATNAFLGSYPITGTPVATSNLTNNSLGYTMCIGKEIALEDYVNKRIYVYNKATGAYQGMSVLPTTTVTSFSFRFSYANGRAWLFNLSAGNWESYRIFDALLPENEFSANAIWFSSSTAEIDWESGNAQTFDRFVVERSLDGQVFSAIGDKDAADANSDNGATTTWALQDATTPSAPVIYYRVKGYLKSGEMQTSEVMILNRTDEAELALGAWPVPADASVHLQFEHAQQGSQLDVIDASGRLVYAATISDALSTAGDMQLDTQLWAEGIYVLRLRDLQGKQVTQRLVIQH